MATTVPEPPKIDSPQPSKPFPAMQGGGGTGGFTPGDGELRAVTDRSPEPARTGIWVALAAIAMSFAALTSALVVRQGSDDWQRILIPRILYLNSAVLVLSSLTLEIARKKVASYIRLEGVTRSQAMRWIGATFALGLAFVAGQYVAWLQLRSEGLYLSTNPNSSFFYVLTAVHAIHVIGGLGGLLRVMYLLRAPMPILRKSTMDSTAYYWHFMGLLWIYLLFIVWSRL